MKRLDVLLIHPGSRAAQYQNLGDEWSAIEPPSLAAMFSSYLKHHGLGVEIIDAPAHNLTPAQIAEMVEAWNPVLTCLVVYGFQPSASTQNMPHAGAIARAIKERNPMLRVLMTGTHPAALPERTMREETIDFVCDREGPQTILKLAQALKAGWRAFHGIPSLWYRATDGKTLMHNQPGPLLSDRELNEEMGRADWHSLPMERYRAHNWHATFEGRPRSPYASMHTSLGCSFKCEFCCIASPFGGPNYRMWNPGKVVEEIDTLVYTHGVRNIKFVDEMFVLSKRHVREICQGIVDGGLGEGLNIWAYARVDTVRDDLLDIMRRAGVRWLALGIESANESVRDGVEKGRFGNTDILKTVRKVQGAGINVIGNFIFGLPFDTQESMRETLALAMEANCEFANFYSAMAYPGSKLYTDLKGKTALPDDPGGPGWIGYSQHSYETLPLATATCSAAEVLAFRDAAFTAYFTNQRYTDMVRLKFGNDVAEHVARMVAQPLPRKLLGDKRFHVIA